MGQLTNHAKFQNFKFNFVGSDQTHLLVKNVNNNKYLFNYFLGHFQKPVNKSENGENDGNPIVGVSAVSILFFGPGTVLVRDIVTAQIIGGSSAGLSVKIAIVLYCTVLYCTVLYCTVLYCTVLYCIITVLYSA